MTRFFSKLLGLSLALVAVGFALRGGSASAAVTGLRILQDCNGGQVAVTFKWDGSLNGVRETWIDLSTSDNGFLAQTFMNAGPLTTFVPEYKWNNVTPGTTHYVRINQLMESGNWVGSQTYGFLSRACVSVANQVAPSVESLPPYPVKSDLILCDDGTKSQPLGALTCSGHGWISPKVTQQQLFTPYLGFPGNFIPEGTYGVYIPPAGSPGVPAATATPTITTLTTVNGVTTTTTTPATSQGLGAP